MTQDSRPADEAEADATPDLPDSPEPPARRRIVRSRRRVVAGVCDGAGRYFEIDPVIFRVVLSVLALTGGIGLIVYGMAWLVIPQEGEDQSEAHRLLSGRVEGTALTAVLVALVGCGLYASMLGNGNNQAFSILLLAAVAGAIYWSQLRRRAALDGEANAVAAGPAADAPPAAQAPPSPATPSWWREPLAKDPSWASSSTGYLWGPDDGPYEEQDRKAWRERRAATRRETSWLGVLTFFVALVAGAIGTAAAWKGHPLGTALEIGLASALAVFGLGFVLSAWAGRARGGTAFWAVLTIALLVGAASVPKTMTTDWATTDWRPVAVTDVQARYEQGSGHGLLDLTALPLGGKTVTTKLQVGAGLAEVRLPQNATVRLHYQLGVGEVQLPGVTNHGVDIRTDVRNEVVFEPAAGTPSAGTIELDVEVGVGQVRVIR
ncbi:PspC domain-containing protein [Streptomyces sp. H10-C2]|uniref:PspC domain-containing protein n=1 Tax=unclassified Streptomyces TaxID=2593676 RepID=UPI0024BBAA52|nr:MULTISPECIES: PspC domain-containing protein [unclassified Streptomyces]MDJ0340578.1 PspC domain-containing protein [Streptomyces sp. PH10-H1]MDJ0370226.1 PspC domain-containing protein [Streptomyces sp. H10-C2]